MDFLTELNNVQKKIKQKNKNSLLIFGSIYVVILIYFLVNNNLSSLFKVSIFYFIFSFVIAKIITSGDVKKYTDIYKTNIILTSFQEIFTNVDYRLDQGMPRETIASTYMMDTGDIYSSNDHILAKYKDIGFEASDVHIQEEYEDSDGNKHYTTLFKGQWFIFEFNKSFKSNIQVREKGFVGSRRGKLFDDNKYHKVELEDADFNDTFKVYAQNELEAFYILTPQTMSRIKELNDKLKGTMLFCFIDNKLHIGLNNHMDLFEPNVNKKINLEEEKAKVLKEIQIITQFVDILNLDNTLFKRREEK